MKWLAVRDAVHTGQNPVRRAAGAAARRSAESPIRVAPVLLARAGTAALRRSQSAFGNPGPAKIATR